MMTLRACTVLCLSLTAPAAAFAQDVTFSPEATMQCLQEDLTNGVACIGASADQCMIDTDGGDTTVGMGGCLDAERAYWDARLNAAFGARLSEAQEADAEAASQNMSAPSQEAALREMQRAWIGFRDKRCAWASALWSGGTGAGPATLGCLMLTTGEQALYLENYVR